MLRPIQDFFAKQTPVARLIFSIGIPLAFFTFAYAQADAIVKHNEEWAGRGYGQSGSDDSWAIWLVFVVAVSVVEYCIWQAPESK